MKDAIIIVIALLLVACGIMLGCKIQKEEDAQIITALQTKVVCLWRVLDISEANCAFLRKYCVVGKLAIRHEILDGNDVISSVVVPLYIRPDGEIVLCFPVTVEK